MGCENEILLKLAAIEERLKRLEESLEELKEEGRKRTELLERLVSNQATSNSEPLSIDDAALAMHREPWTVRKYCRKGQIRAEWVPGRGLGEWRIYPEEILRFNRKGPSPEGTFDNGKEETCKRGRSRGPFRLHQTLPAENPLPQAG